MVKTLVLKSFIFVTSECRYSHYRILKYQSDKIKEILKGGGLERKGKFEHNFGLKA